MKEERGLGKRQEGRENGWKVRMKGKEMRVPKEGMKQEEED